MNNRPTTPSVTRKGFLRLVLAVGAALASLSAHAQTLTVYDDVLQNGFADYSFNGGTSMAATAFVHTGAKSASILGHSFNALSFAHAPGGVLTAIQPATYPILRFWINGGTASGQQFHFALELNGNLVGSSVGLDSYISGGGVGQNVWRQATIDLRQPPFNGANFDRIDIQSDQNAAGTDASATYIDDMVLGQPSAAVTNPLQIDHDVMVAAITSDRFTWRDSNGQPRVASLAHNDAEVANNGAHGGALREYKYQLSTGQTRTATVTTYNNGGYGGFGYVVSHSTLRPCAGGDDSPLGHVFAGTWERIFEGRHHAIFRFHQSYPRNCDGTANPVVRYMPVTIDWVFSTGHDNPLWAVTYDVDQIAAPGQQPAPVNTYDDDSRAPYGELNIDGYGFNDLNGVAWGDFYKFTSTNAQGTGVTWDSPFNWTVANAVPYIKVWLDPPLTADVPARNDATMGIVQTQTITQQDAGGARDLGIGSDITPYWHKTQADGVHSAGAHAIPDGDNWPYQAIGDNLYSGGTTNNARMTWKTQFGFIGRSSYLPKNGVVESSATTAPGYPKKSYSTFIVLGQHSAVPEPVDAQVTQVEAIQALTLTINSGVGSVVMSGPAGITRADNVTYAPAGYNHVYGALAFSAGSNNLDANIAVGSAKTLKKPLIIVGNYTTGADPQTVRLGGVTLVADADYFSSVRASANELWITLNRDITGATNRFEIVNGAAGLSAPSNVVATATSAFQVTISWTAVATATSYEIQRSLNISGANQGFTTLTTVVSPTVTYNNSGLSADTTYLYKVRAINGGTMSAFSAIDAATTTMFTDDPLNAGTTVKAVHVMQLRTAVNAMRAAANVGAQAFTDSGLAAGTVIKAAHVNELRTALDLARSTIGLPAVVYTDAPTVTAGTTLIKALHIADLRNGVK